MIERPTTDDRDAWRAYWTEQGMPWRTEPEIDEERQRFLAERRAVKPDFQKGIYPFRDEYGNIRLTRADVEWLLATHESGGYSGPVDWDDVNQQRRVGLDLRGANLRKAELARLPLARSLLGLDLEQQQGLALDLVLAAATHLEDAHLRGTLLQGSMITGAQFRLATLVGVHLE